MAKYSKFNLVYIIQKWMDSVAGQTFMNYAYSWGASIVILGTLFKLTHLPGANVMLFLGMGTEVFVFFIAAFDRPFDKTAEGRKLANDAELAAQLSMDQSTDALTSPAPVVSGSAAPIIPGSPAPVTTGSASTSPAPVVSGSAAPIIPGSASTSPAPVVSGSAAPIIIGGAPATDIPTDATPATDATSSSSPVIIGGGYIAPGSPASIPPTPAPAVTPETAMAMEEATTTYVERLEELNDVLVKVAALSNRLTTDSEEMENLNRTLTGIARVYEMQLKSASQQITTQDEINEQTRKLALQIADLNAIYARMIEAMTVNMPAAAAPLK